MRRSRSSAAFGGILLVIIAIAVSIFLPDLSGGGTTDTPTQGPVISNPGGSNGSTTNSTDLPSWLFVLCALLLPAPLIFSLLLLIGVRHSSDLIPVFFFGWIPVDLALYFIFFADLSDLGGAMRRPGG